MYFINWNYAILIGNDVWSGSGYYNPIAKAPMVGLAAGKIQSAIQYIQNGDIEALEKL